MTLIEIVILAVALAMDCLTVSLACGLSQKRIIRKPMATMVLLFGIFQGGMTLAGWLGGSIFSSIVKPVDHWIAFILLAYLGGKMLYDAFSGKEEEESGSGFLSFKNIVTMAVATSIDALAVGVSMAFLEMSGTDLLLASGIIALCSSVFAIVGLGVGIFAGKKVNFPVEAVGGIILIGIGLKILLEHLNEAA